MPLPQPEPAPEPPEIPISSVLPPWLSKPVTIAADATAAFEDLGVDKEHVPPPKEFPSALAVQAGVLPLLLPRISQHPGDVCISAPTGSGKTLSYVLPIVQSIKNKACTRLRAVVVVPTRELVGQVEKTARQCAAGTSLQVGVATGSQTLKTEQNHLIVKERRHDPEAYKLLARKLNDMVNFNYDGIDGDEDERHIWEDADDLWPNFVPQYLPKVDILVCTPGRLVDHIKSTRGFSLTDLEWLVIDEADRLLDQSFQEWSEVVNAAIDSRLVCNDTSHAPSIPSLAALYPPRTRVRKVILSATMTRDLEKLASLRLWNPKLVLVETAEEAFETADGIAPNTAGMMVLPTNLREHAVPVDDAAEKPLYLLQILLGILGDVEQPIKAKKDRSNLNLKLRGESSDESSDDSTDDSSDESSDESSDDASDADSNSTSDSDSTTSPSSSSSTATSPTTHTPPPTSTHTQPPKPTALIFTTSTESATRLHHLLTHLHPPLRPFLSLLTKSTTSSALSSLRAGTTRLLIATDRASRGLDIPQLTHVVNYDVPRSVTGYVHRVGRTARAGRGGEAWTLVEGREAAWFWNVVARGPGVARPAGQGVVRVRVDGGGVAFGEAARGRYEIALRGLERDVRGGEGGRATKERRTKGR